MDFSKLFEFEPQQDDSSVEDILAQYRAEESMETADPLTEDYYTHFSLSSYENEPERAEKYSFDTEDEDSVRVYDPSGRASAKPSPEPGRKKTSSISALEDEARRYIAMVQEYAAKRQSEEAEFAASRSDEEYDADDYGYEEPQTAGREGDYSEDKYSADDGYGTEAYEPGYEPEPGPAKQRRSGISGLFGRLKNRFIEERDYPVEDYPEEDYPKEEYPEEDYSREEDQPEDEYSQDGFDGRRYEDNYSEGYPGEYADDSSEEEQLREEYTGYEPQYAREEEYGTAYGEYYPEEEQEYADCPPEAPEYYYTREDGYTDEEDYGGSYESGDDEDEYAADAGYRESGADGYPEHQYYEEEEPGQVWQRHPAAEPEIDDRFNLSGKTQGRRMTYGSQSVDISSDGAYSQRVQKTTPFAHWTEENEPLDEETERRMNRKKTRLERKAEQEALREEERAERVRKIKEGRIEDDAPFEYAEKEEVRRDGAKFSDDDSSYFPPSFREYVASLAVSFVLKLKGAADSVGGTMVDTQEDLGQEVTPAAGAKYYGSFVRSQKMRIRFGAVLLVIMCYMSAGLPLPGMLKDLRVQAAALAAMQLGMMLICLDVVTNAFVNITRPRIGADTLAVLSGIVTAADALMAAVMDSAVPHTPLCALSSLSLMGILIASSLNTQALRKTILVPAIGKKTFAVTGEIKSGDKKLTLLKSYRSAAGFVRRSEEIPPDEAVFTRISPILGAAALLLSVIVCLVNKDLSDFVFVLSAMLVTTVPVCALMAFALPYYITSRRLFKSGTAIAGWSGMCEIGLSHNLIVTDRDLFPGDSVELESPEIFAGVDVKTAISYVGTMMCAASSCVTPCFVELMEDNGCELRPLENFEFLSGGGISGVIDGHKIYCGSTDFISLLRNVSVPYRVKDKTAVFLVVDNKPWGVFIIKYSADPAVRRALVELVRSTRHPVFAVRDFNVTPELLKKVFDLPTDGYDFPPYTERFDLSEPGDAGKSKIAAILCNEGLGPLTRTADVGRSAYVAVRINTFLSVFTAVVGMLYAFFRMCAGFVTAASLLRLAVICAVPVLLVSAFVKTRGQQ